MLMVVVWFMQENFFVQILKYLGVIVHQVSKLISNGSGEKVTYVVLPTFPKVSDYFLKLLN